MVKVERVNFPRVRGQGLADVRGENWEDGMMQPKGWREDLVRVSSHDVS